MPLRYLHRPTWLCLIALLPAAQLRAQPRFAARYDVLISRGTLIDGSGAARRVADVAIRGGRVVMVSTIPLAPARASRVIDARGLIVAPGFIDLHAHLEPILDMPDAQSHVRQGVTLALGGPDGGGSWPFGTYIDSVRTRRLGMNVAFLAGHNSIRRAVMRTENRAPSAAELTRMESMVAQSMHDGAFGLSTGLRYVPGTYSKTDEVVALSRIAADSGGIYTSHLREEGVGLIEGVAEAIEIGRQARIPIELTHHKVVGRLMWGRSVQTLGMVDSARRAGVDVMLDQYPYTASYTSLSVLVPSWALAGGTAALQARMEDLVLRDSIVRGIVELLRNDRGGGDLQRVQFSRVTWDPSLNGKTTRTRRQHVVVVRGYIDGDRVTLLPATTSEGIPTDGLNGPYRVDLVDGTGAVVATHRVSASMVDHSRAMTFLAAIPVSARATATVSAIRLSAPFGTTTRAFR